VTLVYPNFRAYDDNSIFRFPPLGLGYIAAVLMKNGFSVDILDCTFMSQKYALKQIRDSNPKIIGIQSMFSMKDKAIEIARLLRKDCELLIAGGPLPTINPEAFLKDFDVVVLGEGEQTMLDLVRAFENGNNFFSVPGIIYVDQQSREIRRTSERIIIKNLDDVPFPARELFDNSSYKRYYMKKFGYSITTVMTSRGCPFTCDFCSRPVFGNGFRSRTATNIVDEIEKVLSMGYDRIWFADDCFTLNKRRLIEVCSEIMKRKMKVGWECLSRVDTLDSKLVKRMKQAGCLRIFFGIESGDDSILARMGKNITANNAEEAVRLCNTQGVKVGAFFILGYPGENEKTLLKTVKFASSLKLDYLSFTLPYPILGTPLYERLKGEIIADEKEVNQHVLKQKLLFKSGISASKLKLAIIKGMTHFYIQKYLDKRVRKQINSIVDLLTDTIYKLIH